jgi:GDPmannose 4,6-dehydratase
MQELKKVNIKSQPKKRALILGVTGQDGLLLSKLLIKNHYKVYGISRSLKKYKVYRDHLKDVVFIRCNIENINYIKKIILSVDPQEIYNFAGVSDLKSAEKNRSYTIRVNYVLVKKILNFIKTKKIKTKFFQSMSSEMFKRPTKIKKLVVNEKMSLNYNNNYAESKIKLFKYIKTLKEEENFFINCGFLFNHNSFFRDDRFLLKKIANHLKNFFFYKPLEIKNLYAKLDTSHAIDVVRGIYLSMQLKKPVDFVIGSGKAITIKKIINIFLKKLKINAFWKKSASSENLIHSVSKKIIVFSKNNNSRNKNFLVSDNKTILKYTNWIPKKNIDNIVFDLIR